ncbi:MAG: GAF domain-containing protein [Anaerolineales bacterium]|nr:GAF domain-containing protein [Anaerolineales bacterium]
MIKQFFTPPVFPEDEDKTRQARFLHTLLAGTLLVTAAGGAVAVPFIYAEKTINSLLILSGFGIVCLSYWWMRLGRVRAASALLLFGTWPLFVFVALFGGGIQSAVVVFFVVCTVIAGLLLGLRGAVVYSILCCIAGAGMVVLQAAGDPLPRLFPLPPIAGLADLAAGLAMVSLVMHLFTRDLNRSLALTRQRLDERRAAEEALRSSEMKFYRLFETSRDCVFITDSEGRIREANPAAETLWGYSRSEADGMSVENLFLARREMIRLANRLRRHGFVENMEMRGKRRGGGIIDVSVNVTAVRDERGRITGYQGSVRDITRRKRTEAEIARQMLRLSALHAIERAITSSLDLQTVLDLLVRQIVGQLRMDAACVLLLDEEKQILRFAAGAGFRTEALQFTRLKLGDGWAGQAAARRKSVYIPDLAAYGSIPIHSEALTEEDFTAYFGVPLVAKGELCGVMEIFQRSEYPADPGWLNFLETLAGQAAIAIQNVRLLRMTQTNLQETKVLYGINQALAAAADSSQLMKDAVTRLQEGFGYFYVQIYVREAETGDFVVCADSGKIGFSTLDQGFRLSAGEGVIGYVAETGLPFFSNNVDEVVFHKRDPLLPETKSQLVVPIRSGAQILGLLDVHQAPPAAFTPHDLELVGAAADQLAVALQKAQLYADLQNALRQEKEMRAQLIQSEKLAVTGRLMASVSHELNNPLQAIQNALFLLKNERKISAQAKQDLAIVLAETERMAAMLDRLRTTYKASRSEDFRPVEVNAVIEDVHALLATHLRHAKVEFDFAPGPGLPAVNGIRDQIRQVILNLFINAVDAMPEGGRLAVSTADLPGETEVLISVADTGQGIDPAIQPHLFETFITGKEDGTGLGLAISQEIVSKHQGRIRAENRPEGGAVFRIWLPYAKGGQP